MRVLVCVILLLATACGAVHQKSNKSAAQKTTTPARPLNPNQQENDRFEQQILKEIAGREREPAEKVFENIRLDALKNIPAKRFLRIMNAGYSRALGVECTHCHDDGDFASDDKRPKRAAREMAAMHRKINAQLAEMEHLEPQAEQRFINCTTCHRGSIDPMN